MPDVMEAAPSAADAPIEIPRSGTPEYAEWRLNGTLPEAKPKTEDPAPSDPPKVVSTERPGTEPEKQESRRKPDAEARIGELTARTKQLERELEEARKPKETKAESSPAPEKPEYTRPKPTMEKGPDGKPYATYEDYIEDVADWKAEQRIAALQRDQQVAQVRQTVSQKLEEARTRYADYDAVATPVVQELLKPGISKEVFAVMNDSPVLADLLYTIGGSETTKADFLAAAKANPSKALRVALLIEQEIVAELNKDKVDRDETGKFTPKPKTAPEPPIEIGNRGASTLDESERAFKAGDFRAFKAAEDAKALRRRRGV
jgi:hypothetical protein